MLVIRKSYVAQCKSWSYLIFILFGINISKSAFYMQVILKSTTSHFQVIFKLDFHCRERYLIILQKSCLSVHTSVRNVTRKVIRLKGKALLRGFLSLRVYPLSDPGGARQYPVIYIEICLICLFICLSFCLSGHLCIHQFICLSVCLSFFVSKHLSIDQFDCLFWANSV